MYAFRSCADGFLLIGLAHSAIGEDAPVLVGTVTEITDGDTIKVQLNSGPITVRFNSIDVPEKDQFWAIEAFKPLAKRIDGSEVTQYLASVAVGSLVISFQCNSPIRFNS